MKKYTSDLLIKLLLATIMVISILFLTSCGNSSSGMTSLDRKYDQLANKAAKELLQSEADDYTWTTVETGDLIYLYSAKNANEDQVQVHYLAKFDAADEPVDEWVELTIAVSLKSSSVVSASVSYWSARTYEALFDENSTFKGFNWSSSGWFNVNMSDEEFESAKKEMLSIKS